MPIKLLQMTLWPWSFWNTESTGLERLPWSTIVPNSKSFCSQVFVSVYSYSCTVIHRYTKKQRIIPNSPSICSQCQSSINQNKFTQQKCCKQITQMNDDTIVSGPQWVALHAHLVHNHFCSTKCNSHPHSAIIEMTLSGPKGWCHFFGPDSANSD